ncbi:MAG: hypothetical protein RR053_05100 [Evtepia sp.]
MVMRQIRTGIETKAMMEKLKKIYREEKFSQDDGLVTMTVGYILNTAFKETERISDWTKIIDCPVNVENEFFTTKENKTQITRFRLSEYTAEGLDALTKTFSEELGLKAQVGFSVKQVLKAAILLRDEKE